MQTTFRAQLVRDLRPLADADALAAFQEAYPFVDGRIESWSQIVDYYTPELLHYAPFRAEFATEELDALARFRCDLRDLGYERWPEVVRASRALLSQLTTPDT
ncbi:MAG: hypothetical protein KDA05_05960 [Phycisphaerales bacterium]|nr:hypothetical protein [Phycisphaerales bacterium]MCB9841008.1 hypothetical protein [Phycisphaeraceae bacterium]